MPLSIRFLPSAVEEHNLSSPQAEELRHHGIVQLMLPRVLRLGCDKPHAGGGTVRRSRGRRALCGTIGSKTRGRIGARRRRSEGRGSVRCVLCARLVRGLRVLRKAVNEKSGTERDGVLAHLRCAHVCGEDLTEEVANSGAVRQFHQALSGRVTHLSVLSTRTTRWGDSRPSSAARALTPKACDSSTQLMHQHAPVDYPVQHTVCWRASP